MGLDRCVCRYSYPNCGDTELKEEGDLLPRRKSVKHYLETFRKPKLEGRQEQCLTSETSPCVADRCVHH